MKRNTIIGLLRLFRFELPVSAGMCVILGQILSLGSFPPPSLLLLGFLSFFLVSATALILNDYFDYEIDRVNAPSRPLPSGMVTKRDALLLSCAVALAAFLCGYLISPSALFAVCIVWIIGFLYNWRFKRTGFLGNVLVSISVGMTFIFGGISVDNPFDKVVWWFAFFALLLDLGEEIAADAVDIEGDRQAGSRSIAVVWGQRRALALSGSVFMLVVLVSSIPFVLHWLPWYYLIPIASLDGVILFATIRLLHLRTHNHLTYIKRIYRSGSAAMLAIIVIRLFE
jgi:geranylgeranylglycerol-phosphate geranylgeranyltransferase